MDTVVLTGKTCPEGHTDLKVVSQRNDCYIIRCQVCGIRCYEHDLLKAPSPVEAKEQDNE